MPYTAFFPTKEELPLTLPIFPLENAVVMPQAELPLNIFESRYLNMVNDSLASHHLIGMIQPNPSLKGSQTPVYRTGCAGRITAFSETTDGRILITLTGVCRFDVQWELPNVRGYRVVKPDWSRFLSDLDINEDEGLESRESVISSIKDYFEQKDLTTDWDLVEQLSTVEIVHTMAIRMPLEPVDKQVILEAEALSDRIHNLRTALEFDLKGSSGVVRH